MATVKLGVSGSEETLPTLRWMGSPPSWPVTPHKKLHEAEMVDGSLRWGYYGKKREWQLEWGYMSKTDLDTMISLYDETETLRFQNNNEDSTWYDVVFVSLDYDPVRMDIRQLNRYKVRITLREA
jgi:hypothetical protein